MKKYLLLLAVILFCGCKEAEVEAPKISCKDNITVERDSEFNINRWCKFSGEASVSVDTSEEGETIAQAVFTDGDYITVKDLKITVVIPEDEKDKDPPVITCKEIKLTEGDKFDISKYCTFEDENEVSHSLSKEIDTKKVGKQETTVIAKDKEGNISENKITVEIVKKKEEKPKETPKPKPSEKPKETPKPTLTPVPTLTPNPYTYQCWNGTWAIDANGCPVQPTPTPNPYTVQCWDGSWVTDAAYCPVKPTPTPVPQPSVPSGAQVYGTYEGCVVQAQNLSRQTGKSYGCSAVGDGRYYFIP